MHISGLPRFRIILLTQQGADVFGKVLGMAIGNSRIGKWWTARPVFWDGVELSRLSAENGAGA